MIRKAKKLIKHCFPNGYKAIRKVYHRSRSVLWDLRLLRLPPLHTLYRPYFDLGVSAEAKTIWPGSSGEIGDPRKEKLILRCFNSITFENSFKPGFNFDPESETLFGIHPAAEEMLRFVKEHHLKMRMHVLVWHNQNDPAFFCRDFHCVYLDDEQPDPECLVSREELLHRMRSYIYGLVEYIYANGYADCISGWDVVNEALSDNNNEFFRNSLWFRIVGPEYIYHAFLFTREAVSLYAEQYRHLYSGVKVHQFLFYNDYNEWFPEKQEKIIRLLRDTILNPDHEIQSPVIRPDGNGTLLSDGLVDGIGMQGHVDTVLDIGQYISSMRVYSDLTGLVHVTELDMMNNAYPDTEKPALVYKELFKAFIKAVQEGIRLGSVTIWGLTDDRSWRKEKLASLLFDAQSRPKKEFYAVAEAVKDAQ